MFNYLWRGVEKLPALRKYLWALLMGWLQIQTGWQKFKWAVIISLIWTPLGMSPVLFIVWCSHSLHLIDDKLHLLDTRFGIPLPHTPWGVFGTYFFLSWIWVLLRIYVFDGTVKALRYGHHAIKRKRGK